jgi:hypothetical protein
MNLRDVRKRSANSSWIGYLASFMGLIPIWFYDYRARRYNLTLRCVLGWKRALTWGYTGQALLY